MPLQRLSLERITELPFHTTLLGGRVDLSLIGAIDRKSIGGQRQLALTSFSDSNKGFGLSLVFGGSSKVTDLFDSFDRILSLGNAQTLDPWAPQITDTLYQNLAMSCITYSVSKPKRTGLHSLSSGTTFDPQINTYAYEAYNPHFRMPTIVRPSKYQPRAAVANPDYAGHQVESGYVQGVPSLILVAFGIRMNAQVISKSSETIGAALRDMEDRGRVDLDMLDDSPDAFRVNDQEPIALLMAINLKPGLDRSWKPTGQKILRAE